jgi:hypothetical protein
MINNNNNNNNNNNFSFMNDGDFLSNVREEENLLFVGKSYR